MFRPKQAPLDDRTMVTAHVPRAEAEALKDLARSNERSMSAEVRRGIRMVLAENESPTLGKGSGSEVRADGRDVSPA